MHLLFNIFLQIPSKYMMYHRFSLCVKELNNVRLSSREYLCDTTAI